MKKGAVVSFCIIAVALLLRSFSYAEIKKIEKDDYFITSVKELCVISDISIYGLFAIEEPPLLLYSGPVKISCIKYTRKFEKLTVQNRLFENLSFQSELYRSLYYSSILRYRNHVVFQRFNI